MQGEKPYYVPNPEVDTLVRLPVFITCHNFYYVNLSLSNQVLTFEILLSTLGILLSTLILLSILLYLQMLQAIQVLRFHLLELEKVGIFVLFGISLMHLIYFHKSDKDTSTISRIVQSSE